MIEVKNSELKVLCDYCPKPTEAINNIEGRDLCLECCILEGVLI